jgi:ankyrin repeat protein
VPISFRFFFAIWAFFLSFLFFFFFFCFQDELFGACRAGNFKVARLLIEQNPHQIYVTNSKGKSCLHAACTSGNSALVTLICQSASILVNAVDIEEGLAPIFYAASNGNGEMVQTLLAFGADPMARGKSGASPLMFCVQRSSQEALEIARILIENGNTDFQNSLNHACLHSSKKMVELLLLYGADPDSQNEKGETPLMFAARNFEHGHEIVASLLDNAARPGLKTSKGFFFFFLFFFLIVPPPFSSKFACPSLYYFD